MYVFHTSKHTHTIAFTQPTTHISTLNQHVPSLRRSGKSCSARQSNFSCQSVTTCVLGISFASVSFCGGALRTFRVEYTQSASSICSVVCACCFLFCSFYSVRVLLLCVVVRFFGCCSRTSEIPKLPLLSSVVVVVVVVRCFPSSRCCVGQIDGGKKNGNQKNRSPCCPSPHCEFHLISSVWSCVFFFITGKKSLRSLSLPGSVQNCPTIIPYVQCMFNCVVRRRKAAAPAERSA